MGRFGSRIRVDSQVDMWMKNPIPGQELAMPMAFSVANSPIASFGASTVNITAGGSANTFGAWTEIIASTAYDSALMWMGVVSWTTAGQANGTVIGIGIGPSGSETTIANVAVGHSGGFIPIFIPLAIPAGSRIAARVQAIAASRVTTTLTYVFPQVGQFTASPTVDVYGVSLATSRGTNLAASNAWTQITASTTRPYRALLPVISGSNATMETETTSTQQIGIGASGSETAISSFRFFSQSNEIIVSNNLLPPLYVGHVPVGSRLSMRQDTIRTYWDGCIIGIPYS